jgi:hypothetical protein
MKTLSSILLAALVFKSTLSAAQHVVIDDQETQVLAADHNLADVSEEEHQAMLDYCMPNPVSSSCAVRLNIPQDATLSQLIIQNAQGSVVFVSEPLSAGKGLFQLPVEDLPNGNYYYTLTVDFAKIATHSMIIAH